MLRTGFIMAFLMIVSGAAQAALIASSPSLSESGGTTHNFGTVAVGGEKVDVITLENTGADAVFVHEIFVGFAGGQINFLGKDYPGDGGTCADVINPGDSCTLIFAYAPRATAAAKSEIKINYFISGVLQRLVFDLAGNGAAPALMTISNGPTFDFGMVKVKKTKKHTFTVTNTGGVEARAITIVPLSAPFRYVDGDCQDALAAGASCAVTVEFAPQQAGTANTSVVFYYSDGAHLQQSVRAISGTGK